MIGYFSAGGNDPKEWTTTTPSTVTTTVGYDTTTEYYSPDADLVASDANAWTVPLLNGISSAGNVARRITSGACTDEIDLLVNISRTKRVASYRGC